MLIFKNIRRQNAKLVERFGFSYDYSISLCLIYQLCAIYSML